MMIQRTSPPFQGNVIKLRSKQLEHKPYMFFVLL